MSGGFLDRFFEEIVAPPTPPGAARPLMPTGYQQAQLEIENDSPPLKCWFNPKEYTVSKSNTWNFKAVAGQSLPEVQFGSGQPRELSLELLFDSSDSDADDVTGVCNRLFKMMEVDRQWASGNRNTGRPPKVIFAWGRVLSFRAVPKSLSVQFTLFRPDGTPIRASVKLSFQQVENALQISGSGASAQRQNPTTTGLEGLTSHVVRDGDSLQSIAFQAYGDATKWRTIAETHGIDDPLRLRRGTVLTIPGAPD
jgi:nucleoid-associated protein YgaU